MTFDDWIYGILLFVSLCVGPCMKSSTNWKPYLSSLFGLLMAFVTSGLTIWHSLVTVFGFIFLMGLCPPRFFHYLAFFWCFGYLAFFRTCHWFGLVKPPPLSNAMQLLITLRLMGLSFELHDSWVIEQRLKKEAKNGKNQPADSDLVLLKKYKHITASHLGVLCYTYCYIGLFTGPYYKYRTFEDFINWPTRAPPGSSDQLIQQLQEAPLYGVSYLIISHFYSVDYVRTAEFYDNGFGYRLLYMVIIFFIFRLRVYFAWKVAECVCMSAGLGAYPACSKPISGEGPTNLMALEFWMRRNEITLDSSAPHLVDHADKDQQAEINSYAAPLSSATSLSSVNLSRAEDYDFSTIQNISVWSCEFSPTVREGMRSWNKTVQYWLATNFHKRLPGSRTFRTVCTILISAYWHGFHPGYYLAFMTIPLALCAESNLATIVAAFGQGLPGGSLSFLSWVLKMRVFEYCAMGFLLLDGPATLAYWHSIGYCIHIVLAVTIITGYILQRILPRSAFSSFPTTPSATEQMANLSAREI
ncbi:unnamed protein product [Calicophoron daubneyi]|uniref:Lysophospholipid acyltransferase 7 n=1 Tax=Calicophoron daubneyi TaxID=300641 RepID=A0AAV2T202_CALDB